MVDYTREELDDALILAGDANDVAAINEIAMMIEDLEKSQGYVPKDYSLGTSFGQAFESVGQTIGEIPQRVGEQVSQVAAQGIQFPPQNLGEARKTPSSAIFPSVGSVAKVVTTSIGEGIKLGGKGVLEMTPDSLEKTVVDSFVDKYNSLAQTDAGEAIIDFGLSAAKGGLNMWQNFRQNNPIFADELQGVFQVSEIYKPAALRKPVPDTTGFREQAGKVEAKASQMTWDQKRADVVKAVEPVEITPKMAEDRAERTSTDEKGNATYNPSEAEEAMYKVLATKTKVKSANTNQQNLNEVKESIKKASEALDKDLAEIDYIKLDKKQLKTELNVIVQDLLENNPSLVGNPGIAAERLFTFVAKKLDESDGSPLSVMNVRRQLDEEIGKFGRDNYDGNEKAYLIAQKTVRDFLNNKVAEIAPFSEIPQQLLDIHSMFKARDLLRTKAGPEANTRLGIHMQNLMRTTGTVLPKTPLSVALTLGGAYGLATSQVLQDAIPFLLGGGALGAVGYAVHRGTISPDLRKAMSKLLKFTDQAIKKTKSDEMAEALALDRAFIVELMKLPLADVEDLTEEEKAYEYPNVK